MVLEFTKADPSISTAFSGEITCWASVREWEISINLQILTGTEWTPTPEQLRQSLDKLERDWRCSNNIPPAITGQN